jgi:hypothetical protein
MARKETRDETDEGDERGEVKSYGADSENVTAPTNRRSSTVAAS